MRPLLKRFGVVALIIGTAIVVSPLIAWAYSYDSNGARTNAPITGYDCTGGTCSHFDGDSTEVCMFEQSQMNRNNHDATFMPVKTQVGWVGLGQYQFNDKVSSYVNNRNVDAEMNKYGPNDPDFLPGQNWLCLDANNFDTYIGDAHNDWASAWKVFGDNSQCSFGEHG
jgi:hypothetical protein